MLKIFEDFAEKARKNFENFVLLGRKNFEEADSSHLRRGSVVIEKMIEKMTEKMKEKLDVSISTVNREIAALKKKRALERKCGDK